MAIKLVGVVFCKVRNKVIRALFLIFMLSYSIFCFQNLFAQIPYKVERYHLSEGLSQPSVMSLFQDKQGFLWIGTYDGLDRFDGLHFETILYGIPDAIFEDSKGRLWVGTRTRGLFCLDLETGESVLYAHDSDDPHSVSGSVNTIFEDSRGNLWVGTFHGLDRFDSENHRFEHFRHDPEDQHSISGNGVMALAEDDQRNLWIGTNMGLNRFDYGSERFRSISFKSEVGNDIERRQVHRIAIDKRIGFWVGVVRGGIARFDPEAEKFEHYVFQEDDSSSISHNHVQDIHIDHNSNLWIATMGGLDRFDPEENRFEHYRHDQANENSLASDRIRCLYEDTGGNIWVGTDGSGLNKIVSSKRSRNTFQYLSENLGPQYAPEGFAFAIYEESQGMRWVGTNQGKVYVFAEDTELIRIYSSSPDPDAHHFQGRDVRDICEDINGDIWIGTNDGGINHLNRRTNTFRHYERTAGVMCLHCDSTNGLWVGTWMSGLNYLQVETGDVDRFRHNPDVSTSIPGNVVSDIKEGNDRDHLWIGTNKGLCLLDRKTSRFESFIHNPGDHLALTNLCRTLITDPKGNLWIGTNGGLLHFDTESEHFQLFDDAAGLSHNTIQAILIDEFSRLWVTTNRSLTRFDIGSRTFRDYDSSDGIPGNYALNGAMKSPSSGRLYFGYLDDVISFRPSDIVDNTDRPMAVFTKLSVYSKDDELATPKVDRIISRKEAITVSFREHILEFEVGSLNFVQPEKNQYRYRVRGLQEHFIPLKTTRKFTLTNLDPGRYVVEVIASNNDGLWNEKGTSLSLTITPPWYWAWWSKTIHLMMISTCIYFVYRYQLRRHQEMMETLKLKELDAAKSKLYTNITHEFRTPLTVISGMADQIMADPRKWYREGLDMIKGSSHKLLKLVNQMLDLARLEAGNLTMVLVQANIVAYLNHLIRGFQSYASTKNIRIHFLAEEESIVMDFDAGKIETVLSNLISNAIKFSADGGDIYLQVRQCVGSEEKPYCEIRVSDTGVGIEPKQLALIFNRFHQVDSSHTRTSEGTGIGLTLTKELVELMGGEIAVESKVGKGTEFKICLPINNQAPKDGMPALERRSLITDSDAGQLDDKISTSFHDGDLFKILIVEDNPDVAIYITSLLEARYDLAVAVNGREGINAAIKTIPDLIISDIMMPQVDGFELVSVLKQDERTSHIPIILLTAKADMSSKLTGLEFGADAYLVKPFGKRELEIRIRKLIELRLKLQVYYKSVIEGVPIGSGYSEREHSFLLRIRKVIEQNLQNENFGIQELCHIFRISRAQLHRKVKALTGKSTSRFIRSVRLREAMNLLESTDMNVSEVGYAVGFTNRSHFTQVFTEEFGKSPIHFKS